VAVDWTLAEAASWLDPPIGEAQLAALVKALRIQPVKPATSPGQARQPGRPARRYLAVELMFLHAAITPWLVLNRPEADCDSAA
jgi:hypothetical protein